MTGRDEETPPKAMPGQDVADEQKRMEDKAFRSSLVRRHKRMQRARNRGKSTSFWFGVGTFGLIGWTMALPVVVGTFVGLGLDRRFQSGVRWTMGGMMLGVVIGIVNVWTWLERERYKEEDG